jgi:hypothetical protein
MVSSYLAQAVLKALIILGENFCFVWDSYLNCNYKQVQRAFDDNNMPGLMAIFKNEGGQQCEFANRIILAYDKKIKLTECNI